MQVDDKEVNVIDHYTKDVNELVKDVQQLIQRFEDTQSPAIDSLLKWLKGIFKRTSVSLDAVCGQKHFENLIKAAKSIESSQQMASTTVLLYNQSDKKDVEVVLKDLSEKMVKQSKRFNELNEIYRRKETKVFRIQGYLENNVPTKSRKLWKRARKGSQSSISAQDGNSEHAQQKYTLINDGDKPSHSLDRSFVEHGMNRAAEDIAIVRKDGNVEVIYGNSSVLTPLEVIFVDINVDEANYEGHANDYTETRSVPGGRTTLEPPVNAAEENANAGEEEEEEGMAKFDLRRYNGVPCFCCKRDALRPVIDSDSDWQFVGYNSMSFGYSCKRCNGRT